MMIELTNAECGEEGHPVALNVGHVAAVYKIFEGESRIRTIDGAQYIVKESVADILAAIRVCT